MQRITPQEKDFPQWYQDVVKEAELAESSQTRGCGIVKPYGFAIWENIKDELNKRIKADGVENLYFPLFLPMSNLQAEAEHVEGFSPELAVVTVAGGEELQEPLAVRPTSEAVMYPTFAKWINSYRDLPLRVNQWANVVRWEKRPRPFLRWSEFLWQEGHSAFADKREALEEMWRMLDMYKEVYEWMAIPTLWGRKSESEKFAGAEITTTTEVMAKDGKAIQGATSHHLADNFAKAFDIKYLGEDGKWHFVYQNSWGMSWRTLGALIMAHGDDKGLKLPPNVAPTQMVVVPIKNTAEVSKFASDISKALAEFRVKVDDRENKSPGHKFYDWEIKGVPIRIEIGENEVADMVCTVYRRDTQEKTTVPAQHINDYVSDLLKEIQDNMFRSAKEFQQQNIVQISSIDEIEKHPGKFFLASWSEDPESEKLLKEKYSMVSRVLPKEYEDKKPTNKTCFITGEPAKHDWIFAKSY